MGKNQHLSPNKQKSKKNHADGRKMDPFLVWLGGLPLALFIGFFGSSTSVSNQLFL